MKKLCLVLFVVFCYGFIAAASDLDSLVQSERDFSKTSGERGIRDAFVQFLAENSILFRPGPVQGKKWMQDRPPVPGHLSWEPALAVISGGRDLGYTTGPWEYWSKGPGEGEAGYGHFVSIWKKQSDGSWKVILDAGISYPEPPSSKPKLETVSWKVSRTRSDLDSERSKMLKADREFSRIAGADGTARACAQLCNDSVRIYRNGGWPRIGKDAIASVTSEKLILSPLQAEVAQSADLGYTYGASEGEAQKGNYVHIWRKESNGDWKLVLDVISPAPPQTH